MAIPRMTRAERSGGPHKVWWPAFAMLAALGVLWGSYRLYLDAKTAEPARVVRSYFESLVADQTEQAEGYLTGTALASFKRTMANRPRTAAALDSVTLRWPVIGAEIAVAEVRVQVHKVDAGGQGADIQGARVHLTRTAKGWRILAVESAPLPYEGWLSDTDAARAVVMDYVQNVVAGDYDKALLHLAGQARTDAEATLAYVKQARMQTKASEIRATVVETEGDSVWIKAEYHVTVGDTPERPIALLVELRTVGKTPSIVRVNNL